jgi:hypothetical protein
MFVLPILFGVTLWIGLSRLGLAFAEHFDVAWLIGAQAFRLPLELMLYRAKLEGLMPEQMSFAGLNYDIVTGVAASGILLWRAFAPVPRSLALAFNLLGSTLLCVIVGVSIVSFPSFAAFGPDRLNTWVFGFPYVYLPAVMVQMALLGHVLVFRKLARQLPSGAESWRRSLDSMTSNTSWSSDHGRHSR